MKRRVLRPQPNVFVLCALLAGLTACQQAARVPREGRSDFVFIEPPNVTPPNAKVGVGEGPRAPVDVMVRAEPIHPLTKPTYPRAALGVLRAPVLVGVRLTVDANGRVEQIGSSPRALSTPGPLATEFFAAVEEAVRQWRFTPAERRHLVPGTNDLRREDYWLITRVDKTEDVFDVSFTFGVSGDVVPGWAK